MKELTLWSSSFLQMHPSPFCQHICLYLLSPRVNRNRGSMSRIQIPAHFGRDSLHSRSKLYTLFFKSWTECPELTGLCDVQRTEVQVRDFRFDPPRCKPAIYALQKYLRSGRCVLAMDSSKLHGHRDFLHMGLF